MNPVETWSYLALSQNRFLFFYPFTTNKSGEQPKLTKPFASLPEMQTSQFLALMSASQSPGKGDASHFWMPIEAKEAIKSLSSDLHPVVGNILTGRNLPPKHGTAAVKHSYGLRKDFFAGEFILKLQNAACRRMGISRDDSGEVSFRLLDGKAHMLATGIGLLVLEMEVKRQGSGDTVSSELFLEAVYELSHPAVRDIDNLLYGTIEKKKALEEVKPGDALNFVTEDPATGVKVEPGKETLVKRALAGAGEATVRVGAGSNQTCVVFRPTLREFSLGKLAQALLGGVVAQDNCSTRFFSLAYARCPEQTPAPVVRELAYRLGGNFNREYAVCSAQVQSGTHTLFENVQFAANIQGGAVVVSADEGTSPSHIWNYYTTTVKRSFLPLALLAYHEYLRLKHLLSDLCAFHPASRSLDARANHIKHSRDLLLEFRLYYRFSHVSDMTHHNTVHTAWRSALALDTMLKELSIDLAEADNVLEKQEERERERRWRWAAAVISGLVGMNLVHEIAEIWLRMRYSPEAWSLLLHKGDGMTLHALEHDPRYAAATSFLANLHDGEKLGFWITVAVSLVLAVLAYKKGPKLGPE